MKKVIVIFGVALGLIAFSAQVRLLNAPWGWLYVDGTPFFDSPNFLHRIDARVVDGLKEFEVDPGTHEILLLRYDAVPLKQTISVKGSEKEIRLVLKPLKGWVKKTAVMVYQEDRKDLFASKEDVENTVAKLLVNTLREYNVPADLLRLYQKSIYDPHIGMVIINDVLSHPWRYPYVVVMYVLRIVAQVFDEYDYLVSGTFSTIYDDPSGEVSGTLEVVLYDLKDLEIVQKPYPYSEWELYPGFHERYYEGEEPFPSFFTLRWEIGGNDLDLEYIAKKDVEGILPYLLEMLAVDSVDKGIDWREVELRNPDVDWGSVHWLIERAEHVAGR